MSSRIEPVQYIIKLLARFAARRINFVPVVFLGNKQPKTLAVLALSKRSYNQEMFFKLIGQLL